MFITQAGKGRPAKTFSVLAGHAAAIVLIQPHFGVLMGKAPFDVKERACRILSYAAWTVNRFHAQDLIKKAENQGIEPMLEDLLRKNN